MHRLFFFALIIFLSLHLSAQITPVALPPDHIQRCSTMELLEAAIKKNPAILEQWKQEGERRYQAYLQRKALGKIQQPDTLIIPIVFHLVDEDSRLAWITDRNIYDQVEMLNDGYNGLKSDEYKNVIPNQIYNRKGSIPIKFVLARRTPAGILTSGIERRSNTTPGRIDIKSTATGGLDAWDTEKYLNIWVGTFTGNDDNLLGVSTFPFTTTEGPQGVVVSIATLPYTSNVSRSYYPIYSEGATLIHEIGHYFYLWHTFGDLSYCNNQDFRLQPGWPLPDSAGLSADDTPSEKQDNNTIYGNPSVNFFDGCTTETFGEMYGSFMNYFDDRALFMFSNGHRKRVEACIDLYRSNLANSNGAIAPTPINDAYVVSVTPYGSPERKIQILNNVPLTVRLRNYGNQVLNSVKLNLLVDGNTVLQHVYALNLDPGKDTDINLGPLNLTAGNRILTIYSSDPNGGLDNFNANDTLQSFVSVVPPPIAAPYNQNFNGGIFPPAGWQIWNPNNDGTWSSSSTSGYPEAGSATMQFRNFSGAGQLDELVMPALDMGTSDSSVLSFNYAYAVYNNSIVSTWDGLEIYLSNDNGRNYQLIYKKTGNFLKTLATNQTTAFTALPTESSKWAQENINLTKYLNGNPLLIKFRATNAKGNNLYIDNVAVSAVTSLNRDVQAISISGVPQYVCGEMPTPSATFRSNGKDTLKSLVVSYRINNGSVVQKSWSGTLTQSQSALIAFDKIPNLNPGSYLLTVYTSQPNGIDDEFTANDTISTWFYVMGRATTPVSESFESSGFPPNQWVLQQNGNGHSWDRTTSAASDGSASVMISNFQFNMEGKSDNLISPVVAANSTYDSLFVSFDYAYAPGSNYPGTTGNPEDTLNVKVTLDCGQTFTSIFKDFGNSLVTVPNPESRKNSSFVPGADDWKNARIYLDPTIGKSDYQIFFESKGNHRNNLFIDNIKIFGIVVPPLLKEQGYLLYPSPFQNQLIVRNYQQPTDLKSVQIFNAVGQLIWQQQFQGDAQKQIFVNTSGWERGIYIVKMIYTSKTIVGRVLKL